MEDAARLVLFFLQAVATRPHDGGDHQQRDGEAQIGMDDRLRRFLTVRYQCRTAQRRRADAGEPAEDQRRADAREDRGAQRVERLREGQAARRRFRLAEQRDQRVGDDLNDRDARTQHEQRNQEHREGRALRRRDEQQAADHHRDEADRRGAHIARLAHDRRRGQREQRIGQEERRLDQHRRRMVEREQLLQLRDDDVVEAGDTAEDEEQRDDEDAQIGRVIAVRGIAAGCGLGCVDMHGHGTGSLSWGRL